MELKKEFVEHLQALLPSAESNALVHAIQHEEPSVAVRANVLKHFAPTDGAALVPWCPEAMYLDERPQFTFDPAFAAGSYYVQDASSMFISHVIRSLISEPVRYLDLCAAPGGKTTTALNALPEGSLVVANEVMPRRVQILLENTAKWGSASCVVTQSQARDFGKLKNFFDVIAADVPCSGEGMMRKDDDAVQQWSTHLVTECADLQYSIISDVWDALRPGGLLIYSTCTYNCEENERQVERIISEFGAEPIAVPVPSVWNIHPAINSDVPCYRFMPHCTRGEGLFMCVLRKQGDASAMAMKPSKPQKKKTADKRLAPPSNICDWLSGDFATITKETEVTAVPAHLVAEVEFLCSKLNVLRAGISLSVLNGKKWEPAPTLALAAHLNKSAFPIAALDYPQAIAYLRGEAISLADAPMGYVLVEYCGAVLGFAKNLGNRANNLYPKEWRIRSSHAPITPPASLFAPVDSF